MASETVASGHASATGEQIVNKEKSEAIADMITSLANEDEAKHDKAEDPNGGPTTPSSKTEDETNGELGAVEVQKSDDSPALEASAEVNLKHDKIEDEQTPAAPKPEPAAVVENTDDPVSLDAYIEDNLKEENQKEVIPDSHATDDAGKSQPKEPPSIETTVEKTAQQLQKEPVGVEDEKQPETVGIPEASAETIEKSNNAAEDIPQTESEAELVKEEKTRVPEIEPEEKPQEAEQPTTVTIPELSTEAITIEEKTREFSAEILKETNESEAVNTEPVVEVHRREEADIEVVKEIDTSQLEAVPAIVEKPEPVSTEVEEKPRELVEVAKDVGETSKEMETKQEIVFDTKIEDTIKDQIPLKEEKTDKEEETSIIANTEQVSVNEEAEADPENLVEPSLEVAEKVAVVDEISSAVSDPVRETLASNFEQETTKTDARVPEETTKGNDATKTSSKELPEEIPAKPAQKQSNNIISKVKQSLVKARKAIIGKSPSSKNHSTEAKDDIPVK